MSSLAMPMHSMVEKTTLPRPSSSTTVRTLHIVEHGLDGVRQEVLKQVARKIIMSVENIVGDEARLAVAELPLRVL